MVWAWKELCVDSRWNFITAIKNLPIRRLLKIKRIIYLYCDEWMDYTEKHWNNKINNYSICVWQFNKERSVIIVGQSQIWHFKFKVHRGGGWLIMHFPCGVRSESLFCFFYARAPGLNLSEYTTTWMTLFRYMTFQMFYEEENTFNMFRLIINITLTWTHAIIAIIQI